MRIPARFMPRHPPCLHGMAVAVHCVNMEMKHSGTTHTHTLSLERIFVCARFMIARVREKMEISARTRARVRFVAFSSA